MNGTNSTNLGPQALQGWTSSPHTRGTFDIMSNCLVLILASTWTVLHLNVPGQHDSWLVKTVRKAKWMVVTIFFPEFIFAHAMEERSMAVDVLTGFKSLGYKVDFERRCWHDLIDYIGNYRAYNKSDSRAGLEREEKTIPTLPPKDSNPGSLNKPENENENSESICPNAGRRSTVARGDEVPWTITHAIFANMGGFVIQRDGDPQPTCSNGFTLLSLCDLGELEGPPQISEVEIKDKGKADSLVKLLVLAQFLWLAASIVARRIEHLPYSQLEMATLAFTSCSALTYVAAWNKPKDVEVPFIVHASNSSQPYYELYSGFFTDFFSFGNRMRLRKRYDETRIPNDNYGIGEGGYYSRSNPMIGWTLIGTAVFGGIHFLAWDFNFPTKIEKTLWRITTVAATVAPLLLPISVHPYKLYSRSGKYNSYIRNQKRLLFWFFTPAILFLYILARLCIIALAFSSLRAMPRNVYKTTWTKYLISIQ